MKKEPSRQFDVFGLQNHTSLWTLLYSMTQPSKIPPEDHFSDNELEKMVLRAELRARLIKALDQQEWISRQEAAIYIRKSLSSLNRVLKDNSARIRVTSSGRDVLINRPNLKQFMEDSSIGGDEVIPREN